MQKLIDRSEGSCSKGGTEQQRLSLNEAYDRLDRFSNLLANESIQEIEKNVSEMRVEAIEAIAAVRDILECDEVLDVSLLGNVLICAYQALDGFWGHSGYGLSVDDLERVYSLGMKRVTPGVISSITNSFVACLYDHSAIGLLNYLRFLKFFVSEAVVTLEEPAYVDVIKNALKTTSEDHPPTWTDFMHKQIKRVELSEVETTEAQGLIPQILETAGFME